MQVHWRACCLAQGLRPVHQVVCLTLPVPLTAPHATLHAVLPSEQPHPHAQACHAVPGKDSLSCCHLLPPALTLPSPMLPPPASRPYPAPTPHPPPSGLSRLGAPHGCVHGHGQGAGRARAARVGAAADKPCWEGKGGGLAGGAAGRWVMSGHNCVGTAPQAPAHKQDCARPPAAPQGRRGPAAAGAAGEAPFQPRGAVHHVCLCSHTCCAAGAWAARRSRGRWRGTTRVSRRAPSTSSCCTSRSSWCRSTRG